MSAALADPSLTPAFVNSFEFKPTLVSQDFDLAVIDVASGSDTRVLVKKVLEWSSSQGKGQLRDPLFTELQAVYSAVKTQLLE
jgi:phosphomevalonate kinase